MSSLEQQLKKRIEAGDVDLPVLPAVATQVLALTRSENSDARDLAQLIQNDQSLAGHVMRMANSAAYSSQGKIQTLQQAIAKLGMRQLGQMALTVSVGQSIFKADAAMQTIVEQLWRHSLACAAWSREIARVGRVNTEVAFLCGLLHQIGKPVAVRTIAQLQATLDEQYTNEQLLALIEKYNKVLGVNLARRWQLPESVVESINYIDDYFGAPSARKEVMTVNAARLFASATLENFSSQSIDEIVAGNSIFQDLNLYDEDIADLAEKIPAIEELLATLTL